MEGLASLAPAFCVSRDGRLAREDTPVAYESGSKLPHSKRSASQGAEVSQILGNGRGLRFKGLRKGRRGMRS